MQISKLRTRRGDIPAIAMIDNKSPVLIAATLPFGFSGLLTASSTRPPRPYFPTRPAATN